MKKYFILLTSALLTIQLNAQNAGVEFQHISFNKALEKARKEKKMLFVDCYTTWCGPCKYMSEKVFVKKEVGDYFSEHFVSVKYDVEAAEAQELNAAYSISVYPTFLIIGTDGKLINVLSGSSPNAKAWISRVENAYSAKNTTISTKEAYDKDKSWQNAQIYMAELSKIKFRDGVFKVLEEQFSLSDDKIQFVSENNKLITQNMGTPNTDVAVFIINNRDKLSDSVKKNFDLRLRILVLNTYMKYILDRLPYNKPDIKEISILAKKMGYDKNSIVFNYPALIEIKNTGNYKKFLHYISNSMDSITAGDRFAFEKSLVKCKSLPDSFLKEYKTYLSERSVAMADEQMKSKYAVLAASIN